MAAMELGVGAAGNADHGQGRVGQVRRQEFIEGQAVDVALRVSGRVEYRPRGPRGVELFVRDEVEAEGREGGRDTPECVAQRLLGRAVTVRVFEAAQAPQSRLGRFDFPEHRWQHEVCPLDEPRLRCRAGR